MGRGREIERLQSFIHEHISIAVWLYSTTKYIQFKQNIIIPLFMYKVRSK